MTWFLLEQINAQVTGARYELYAKNFGLKSRVTVACGSRRDLVCLDWRPVVMPGSRRYQCATRPAQRDPRAVLGRGGRSEIPTRPVISLSRTL